MAAANDGGSVHRALRLLDGSHMVDRCTSAGN
jgi:hypothetical protein